MIDSRQYPNIELWIPIKFFHWYSHRYTIHSQYPSGYSHCDRLVRPNVVREEVFEALQEICNLQSIGAQSTAMKFQVIWWKNKLSRSSIT